MVAEETYFGLPVLIISIAIPDELPFERMLYFRIFDVQTKKILSRTSKCLLPVSEKSSYFGKNIRLYHDDTLQTFFRRLCFSPDGKLIVTPAGVTDFDGVNKPLHTTYIYSRYSFKQPIIVLPSPDQYTVAAKFCPLLYKLRPHKETNPPAIPLGYRMIFAVATKSSVYIYDTQQKLPFALISNIHYTRITDLTWSNDGRILVVSSTDGFCSLITFAENELGEIYEQKIPIEMDNIAGENKEKPVDKLEMDKSNIMNSDESGINLSPTSNITKSGQAAPIDIKRKSKLEVPKSEPVIIEIEDNSVSNDIANFSNLVEKADNLLKTKPLECDENKDVTSKMTEDESKENLKSLSNAKNNNKPTPIAFRRKPTVVKEKIIDDVQVITEDKPKIMSPESVIIDKTIISTQEKFDSPEKKDRPATPISIRRHPRTPTNTATPTSKAENDKEINSEQKTPKTGDLTPKSKTSKKATRIAVRKQPRSLIPAPVEKTSINEEAMDAWPLEKSPEKSPPNTTVANSTSLVQSLVTDATEDIVLVYEDTQTTERLTNKSTGKDATASTSDSITTADELPDSENNEKEKFSSPIKKTKTDSDQDKTEKFISPKSLKSPLLDSRITEATEDMILIYEGTQTSDGIKKDEIQNDVENENNETKNIDSPPAKKLKVTNDKGSEDAVTSLQDTQKIDTATEGTFITSTQNERKTEVASKISEQNTPESKKPRRIELKTISTSDSIKTADEVPDSENNEKEKFSSPIKKTKTDSNQDKAEKFISPKSLKSPLLDSRITEATDDMILIHEVTQTIDGIKKNEIQNDVENENNETTNIDSPPAKKLKVTNDKDSEDAVTSLQDTQKIDTTTEVTFITSIQNERKTEDASKISSEQNTPECKKSRRIELKTISTSDSITTVNELPDSENNEKEKFSSPIKKTKSDSDQDKTEKFISPKSLKSPLLDSRITEATDDLILIHEGTQTIDGIKKDEIQNDVENENNETKNIDGPPAKKLKVTKDKDSEDAVTSLQDTQKIDTATEVTSITSTQNERKTEDACKISEQNTPECKKPRRIELKTISTPKSKKKLL